MVAGAPFVVRLGVSSVDRNAPQPHGTRTRCTKTVGPDRPTSVNMYDHPLDELLTEAAV